MEQLDRERRIASAGKGESFALAFIGFGEAAMAFVEGWGGARAFPVAAYDIKTDSAADEVRAAKWADYERWNVAGGATADAALAGASIVFSTVTADQALTAAGSAAGHIASGALYLDCNSCAPGTKVRAGGIIAAAGGRYVDVAVMQPVHPGLHRTPLLVSGAHAADAMAVFGRLGMAARPVAGEIGTASSIKMVRSVMIKGLEALTLECVLSARRAGVDEIVLDSLEATFPGFGWRARAGYMMERATTHGVRRAAEMREVALTVAELGLGGAMARATADWQQRVGDLRIPADLAGDKPDDYRARADAILRRLAPDGL